METLWDNFNPVTSLQGITVPQFLQHFEPLSIHDVASICTGGSAGGAYAPVYECHRARVLLDTYEREIRALAPDVEGDPDTVVMAACDAWCAQNVDSIVQALAALN